jgi:uncharacterized protein
MDARLVIDVARLDPDGEAYEGTLDDAVLDLNDEYLKPFAGIRYSLDVRRIGRELLVRGTLEQDFDAVCSRCGGDFDFTVKVPDFLSSMELDEKTEFADLTDELRESIILHLPTYPVCREGCLGVCQQCGKNLNEGPCSCSRERHDNRWDILDSLRKEEDNGVS